jgi:hypothetical protein
MRRNNVVDVQQHTHEYGPSISAKRLSLKEYEAHRVSIRRISKTLLRPIRRHIQLSVA